MEELKACPLSPERAVEILWSEVAQNQQPLHCTRKELCGAVEMAEEAICRPALENKPLTVEQLRGMVGEPVWIYRKDYPKAKGYKVMDVPGSELFFFTDKTFISPQEYGKTWLAYARKPEQEGRKGIIHDG